MRSVARAVTFALAVAIAAPAAPASAALPVVRDPGSPAYVVSLHGDATGHRWSGREAISFTNLETDPLSAIWLRLWSNGVLGCRRVAISVSHVRGGDAADISHRCTAMRVRLDAPLTQGGRTTVSMRVMI